MGFVDPEMISYLLLMTSLFVISPALLQNVERQRQLEIKFDKIVEQNGIEDVAEILQRAVLKFNLIDTFISRPIGKIKTISLGVKILSPVAFHPAFTLTVLTVARNISRGEVSHHQQALASLPFPLHPLFRSNFKKCP